ncbi:MAG: HAMP domain-containing histidine kinase [Mariniblastus sp.]|nr:HAMP domain-containing histidine kinase [Mariniblastus sp.]
MADQHSPVTGHAIAAALPGTGDHPVLFDSPALLWFALSHCREKADGPNRWEDLNDWSNQYLLPLLRSVVPVTETCDFPDWDQQKHRIALRHRRFLYQPGPKRLVKFLQEVSRGQGVPLSKRACADWLAKSELDMDRLPGMPETGSARILRVDELIESSYYRSPSAFGFAPTWTILQGFAQLAFDFEDRLRLEKLKSMKQLAYGASHEVNNPLANIATRAETLIRSESNPERRRLLSVVHAQSMKAHDMIADMMLFAHPPPMQMETCDLAKLTRQLLDEMADELRTSDIEVLIRSYPGVRMVPVDPTHFAVAIKALLRNSIEAIGSAGQIRVRLFRESTDWLGLSVVDNGPGVSPDQADHLFDPFYSGREAGRGLGFGLSKAWRIIREHGGEIFCDDSCQNGGKFEIRLPVTHKSLSRIDIARAA